MKTSRERLIVQKALRLLSETGVKAAPVNVEKIAASLGIDVRKSPTDDDISGFLFRQPRGRTVIGVNTLHHPNRQRFTIGHEIGHFLLHQYDNTHVDRFVVKLRSS